MVSPSTCHFSPTLIPLVLVGILITSFPLASRKCHMSAFWKHGLPLPPSALGSGMPHGSCNQSWEYRIWWSSQFGSPVPFQPDLPQNLPHTLLPLVCPVTQLSLELPCAFLFWACPNSHSSVRTVPIFQDPVKIAGRAFLVSSTLLSQYLVNVCSLTEWHNP